MFSFEYSAVVKYYNSIERGNYTMSSNGERTLQEYLIE